MTAPRNHTDTLQSHRRFVRLLWLGTVLIILFVIGIVAWVVEQNRRRDEAQAIVLTENYSRILEEGLAGFISKIDITLLTVRDEVARQMSSGGINENEMNAFLARQDENIPEALGLRVVDAQGIIRYAVNDVKVRNASIADRPQFIRLRDDRNAGLVFSKPVLGRAAQKWMITLGRRIDNADGSFAGDVHVAVGLDHFIDLFSKVDLGAKGNIGLWDQTSLIARYTKADAHGASIGSTTPSEKLRALLNSDSRAAAYHARSGIDQIARTFYFRRIGQYPLFLVVGLADEDYLAEWRGHSLVIGAIASLFVIVTLIFAWLAQRASRRRADDRETLRLQDMEYTAKLERSNQDVEAARRQNELILTSAGEGICGVDLEGKVMFVNPAARQMFGWGTTEGTGLLLHAHIHHHHADGSDFPSTECSVYKTLRDGQRRQVKDDVYWRKGGPAFPVEFTVSAMEQDGIISGAVLVFKDITERKQLEERITRMAMHDDLTGLANRSFLSEALQRMAATAQRRHESVGILYLDLDGFKLVNDRLGHAAGDLVLRAVADRLRACVRAEDVAARLGGDEFLVATLTGRENARDESIVLAKRIIEALGAPVTLPEGIAQVGASIGIAMYPDSHHEIDRCIQKADAAMYQAKDAGKGCYVVAVATDSDKPATATDFDRRAD